MKSLKSPVGLRFTYEPKSDKARKFLLNVSAEKLAISGITFSISQIYYEKSVRQGVHLTEEFFMLYAPEISPLYFYVDIHILNELLTESKIPTQKEKP
jgi:hypothetical protein